MPARTPLAMPLQQRRQACRGAPPPADGWPALLARRLFVTGLVAALTASLVALLARALAPALGWAPLSALLGLFAINVAWIALAAVTALCGAWALARPKLRQPAMAPPVSALPAGVRVAVLVPVRAEPMAHVAARLKALANGLARQGLARQVDLVVLSDSQDEASVLAERQAIAGLRTRLAADEPGLYYRRRRRPIGHKAGNIANWVRGWGGAYTAFAVLDADSRMTAALIDRLARQLVANPDCALLQTFARLRPGRTRFAKLQALASCLYGPVIAQGLAFRQRDGSNFWGHNAVIRTAAFARACRLPRLPGKPPLGGRVLSHDFIEAGLLRRAGWRLHLLPALKGSWEEPPPSLAAYAARDRRWCQGNLQHSRFLGSRGLPWASRSQLVAGIIAYLSAPLWLALLALSVGLLPTATGATAIAPGLAGVVALLLAPRIAGCLAWLAGWTAPGGRPRRQLAALAGAAGETLASAVIAPLLLVYQMRAVLAVLAGRDGGWQGQRSPGASGATWPAYWRWHGSSTVVGASLILALAWVAPRQLVWLLPVLLGPALAVALERWASGPARAGRLIG